MEQQVNIPVGASIDRSTGKIIPITREGGQDELNALIERLAKAGLGWDLIHDTLIESDK